MTDFFRGWRRKAGCVSLVIACVFAAGWVRSLRIEDDFSLRRGLGEVFIVSMDGGLYAFSLRVGIEAPRQNIRIWTSTKHPYGVFHGISQLIEWDWRWRGFGYFNAEMGFIAAIPYWAVVIPLTLLSAFLLLSKPRKLNSTLTAQSVGELTAE